MLLAAGHVPSLTSWRNADVTELLDCMETSFRKDRSQGFGHAHKDDDGLLAGRQRNQSLIPCRVNGFSFSTASTPALEPTQPLIHWVPGIFSRATAAAA
jgi:hypothetical protein